ncbi:MAG: methylated DNA-protein cysteine methyltransferase [Ignavibacteriaceae bacterium]
MNKRKTWQEKLNDNKCLPTVIEITEKQSKRWGSGTCAIPSPKEVDEIMRHVPKGKLITINNIREIIAERYNATISCPMTTGIFAWISANAAEEMLAEGKKKITPYWRTLKSKGELNSKYPGGLKHQMELLESEGHEVYQKGSHFFVTNYEKHLLKV